MKRVRDDEMGGDEGEDVGEEVSRKLNVKITRGARVYEP